MKKIIALLLIVVISISISACAPQKDDFVGEWKSEFYDLGGGDYFYDTITFNADGTFVQKFINYSTKHVLVKVEGTWVWDQSKMELRTIDEGNNTYDGDDGGDFSATYKYNEKEKTLTLYDKDYEQKYKKTDS